MNESHSINNNSFIYKFLQRNYDKSGFALPQILVLAIGISITLVGLMNVSINRLSTSKFSKNEMQAKNATESAFNSLRALLNNSKSGAYYYFWLLKTCASGENQCPDFYGGTYGNIWPGRRPNNGIFADPSTLYWQDEDSKWCQENKAPKCFGRQVAPSCTYLGKDGRIKEIPWRTYSNHLNGLLNGNEIILNTNGSNRQSFKIISTDYLSNEQGGTNSILFEGYYSSLRNQNYIKTATNRVRANISVYKNVPNSGFAFISAGENENDKNSLFLGNFKISSNGQKGTILWRKNINPFNSYIECRNILRDSGIGNLSYLPDSNKDGGGIFVQALQLPDRPQVKNQGALGSIWNPTSNTIICLGDKNGNYFVPNCTFLEASGYRNYRNQNRTYTIDDLIVRGKGAYFGISTTDNSKVTLIVRGSIDISNGGKICHRNGTRNCGTGKPENLTILFSQPDTKSIYGKGKQRLECSAQGGMKYILDANSSLGNFNNIPFNTLNVSSTGNNNEQFSAFIYAPDTTFSTASPETEFYSRVGRNWNVVSAIKGVYAYIEYPGGTTSQRTPKLFRNIKGGLIPYTTTPDKDSWDRRRHGFDDVYIIGAGRRSSNSRSQINSMLNMALIWDSKTKNYFLIGFLIERNQVRFVDRNYKNRIWRVFLGNDPFDSNAKRLLDIYGIDLRRVSSLDNNLYFKGSAWVKNACFDMKGKGQVSWDFDEDYIEKLVEKNKNNLYRFGVPYYRGKSIKVWDTLRSFK